MDVAYTKLRYIKSKDKDLLIQAIQRLPFKIEIKEILNLDSWYCWFTITDGTEFQSVDLD